MAALDARNGHEPAGLVLLQDPDICSSVKRLRLMVWSLTCSLFFRPAQIGFVLKQAEDGTPVAEVCRKAGISDATFYN